VSYEADKLDKCHFMPRRTSLWLLLGSLLLNCFLLGLVVAPMVRPHPPFPHYGGGPPGGPGGLIEHLVRGLSPADADKLRAAYTKDQPVLDAGHQNIEAAMQEVSSALAKPSVDQAELQRALDDVAAAHGRIQAAMSDLVKHAASDLSADGRHILAEQGLHPPHMMGMPPPGMDVPPPPHFGEP